MTICTPRNACHWKITGTNTFRLASSKLFTHGTNLQNPSPEICEIYIPDDGYIFLQADQAGAEALIVAYLCEAGRFRSLFTNGIKVHVYVAMHFFASYWQIEVLAKYNASIDTYLRCDIDRLKTLQHWKELATAIKNHDRYYAIGKMICHASNYGMTPKTLRVHVLERTDGKIALTKDESEYFLSTYHGLFPEIRQWHERVKAQLRESRILYNLQRFPRRFTKAWGSDFEREAFSFVPQSTVGTITNVAFEKMQDYIEDETLDWHLLNNKHDSYLMEVPNHTHHIKFAGGKMKHFLEQDLVSPRSEPFRMKSELSVGMNWRKWHEKDNPQGLKEIEV